MIGSLFIIVTQDRMAPVKVNIVAKSFSCRGMKGSLIEGNINHLMVAPPIIAPVDRKMVGIVTSRSLLFVW